MQTAALKTKFSWRDAPDLIQALTKAQNSPCNANRDILTFASFCDSRDELEGYLCKQEIRVQNWEQDREMGFVS